MAGAALLLAVLIGGWLANTGPPLCAVVRDPGREGWRADNGGAGTTEHSLPFQRWWPKISRATGMLPTTDACGWRRRACPGVLVGFELMETQKLGASQFAEQIRINQRALEGELPAWCNRWPLCAASACILGDSETNRIPA